MAEVDGPGEMPEAGDPGEMPGSKIGDATTDADADRFAQALAALRTEGGEALDPVGMHYLEALHRRTLGACGEPRRLLELRLEAALARAAQRLQETRASRDRQADARSSPNPASDAGLASLRALNERLDAIARLPADQAPGELRALRRFRRSWSRISAEDQVRRALDRGPEQAGPLNSHMLVLRSLDLMRALSPDYLQSFLSRVDALLWLEQAEAPRPAAETRPARRTRRKKDAPPAG